ncbi:MAG: hypothetical protein WAW61_15045, partial [Methylococcaceae bacterium]
PKSLTSRPDNKSPRANIAQTDNKPSWRFSTVDKNGPFAWPIGKDKELEIVGKLHGFDSMEWTKIIGTDHHFIPVSNLSKEAQKRLDEIKQDDIDQVFSFHLQGKPRIICIRDRHIAKLLWYDPDHKVCTSIKKHT